MLRRIPMIKMELVQNDCKYLQTLCINDAIISDQYDTRVVYLFCFLV